MNPNLRLSRMLAAILTLSILALLILSTISQAGINDGLVAHYPFNGNANDASGYGNHGTVYGATLTADRFGNLNSAYSFNGIDNYIEVPNSDSLNPGAVTVSAWCKVSAFGESGSANVCKWQALVFKQSLWVSNNHYYCVNLGDWDGIWRFGADTWTITGFHSGAVSIESIRLGEWYHIVGTFDAQEVKLYINGVLQQTSPTGAPLNAGSKSLFIGYTGMW